MTMTALDGDSLELVIFADGGCALLRNGHPVTDMHWLPCHMAECVEQLLRLGWRP